MFSISLTGHVGPWLRSLVPVTAWFWSALIPCLRYAPVCSSGWDGGTEGWNGITEVTGECMTKS